MKSRESIGLAGLLVLTFALRAWRADQPIVENYVGRQIPTAMVARNLERGSGFLRPRLDTAPFPNLFVVEPPIYEAVVVALRRATALPLEPAGRLVSGVAMVIGGWGLFGLVRRREGSAIALLSLLSFAIFPLTIRYGRAFQPDALMLGSLLAGLNCWDMAEAGAGWFWRVIGAALLATGLALKVVAAYVLVPLIAVTLRPRRGWKVALALATLVPALLWYVHAAVLLSQGNGSRASADNTTLWLSVLDPTAAGRGATIALVARFLAVRAFTPLGIVLAFAGLVRDRGGERLWRIWGGSALASLAILIGKLHHEYYLLALAPVAAVGVAKGLLALSRRGRGGFALALAAGGGLVGLSVFQVSPTWRTPPEWSTLSEAAAEVRSRVPERAWVVAPEALLFASDRRGCRLETTRSAVRRAAGEWGVRLADDQPLALVEFYKRRGARYFADVVAEDAGRLALHDAIRRRYNVLVDRPGVLLAVLNDAEGASHGDR